VESKFDFPLVKSGDTLTTSIAGFASLDAEDNSWWSGSMKSQFDFPEVNLGDSTTTTRIDPQPRSILSSDSDSDQEECSASEVGEHNSSPCAVVLTPHSHTARTQEFARPITEKQLREGTVHANAELDQTTLPQDKLSKCGPESGTGRKRKVVHRKSGQDCAHDADSRASGRCHSSREQSPAVDPVPKVSEADKRSREKLLNNDRTLREVKAIQAAREGRRNRLASLKAAREVQQKHSPRIGGEARQCNSQAEATLAATPTDTDGKRTDQQSEEPMQQSPVSKAELSSPLAERAKPKRTSSAPILRSASPASSPEKVRPSPSAGPRRTQSGKTLSRIDEIEANRQARRAAAEAKRKCRQGLVDQGADLNVVRFQELLQEWRMQNPPCDAGTNTGSGGKIQVCLRKRPLLDKEVSAGVIDSVSVISTSDVVKHELGRRVDQSLELQNWPFKFDRVLDHDSKNAELFDLTARKLVTSTYHGQLSIIFFACGRRRCSTGAWQHLLLSLPLWCATGTG